MKHYVIAGNGVAAAGCVEGIRSVDSEGPITLVSRENHPVYCRPLISYYLAGKTKPERMGYRPERFYEDNGCTVLYGTSVDTLSPEASRVTLSDGRVLPYDALCVAAGSSPFVPPMEGLEKVEKKFSFMTLDDALALEQALTPDSRVLIVGAGLIGLKCAEGICGRAAKITVCDLADRVLSSILDADTAPMVSGLLESKGLELLLGDSVARFEPGKAHMRGGKTVEFDVLVTAVGVRPNTGLVRDAGGAVNRGIVIDETMATSLPGVYAAGDCAEGYDLSLGANRVLALLPSAYIQGYTAGVNMAGGRQVFDRGIPMNAIGFFGMHIMTAGTYVSEAGGGRVFAWSQGGKAKKFFCKDGLLKGYILIDAVDRGGIYTALIREQTPLDTVDLPLLVREPTFMAFPAQARKEKFASEV